MALDFDSSRVRSNLSDCLSAASLRATSTGNRIFLLEGDSLIRENQDTVPERTGAGEGLSMIRRQGAEALCFAGDTKDS